MVYKLKMGIFDLYDIYDQKSLATWKKKFLAPMRHTVSPNSWTLGAPN